MLQRGVSHIFSILIVENPDNPMENYMDNVENLVKSRA